MAKGLHIRKYNLLIIHLVSEQLNLNYIQEDSCDVDRDNQKFYILTVEFKTISYIYVTTTNGDH